MPAKVHIYQQHSSSEIILGSERHYIVRNKCLIYTAVLLGAPAALSGYFTMPFVLPFDVGLFMQSANSAKLEILSRRNRKTY